MSITDTGDSPRSARAARLLELRGILARPEIRSWLGIGLVVRLLIAPFTVSADMLAVYWRSHLIAYDGEVFGEYLVNMGAHYTHAVSLRILDPVLPDPDVLWTDPWWWSDSAGLAPQVQRAFVDTDGIFGTLLALKLPYLLFDLLAGVCILALVARLPRPQARRAWAFWMLSPIGLYASYAFGRYEMFAVALVVAALWACEVDRPWIGAVLIGLAITMRGYPLILVPVFALVVDVGTGTSGLLRRAAWTALSLLPLGVILYTNTLLADTVGEFARLRDFNTGSTFLAYTFPVDGPGPVYVFGLFVIGLYVLLAGRTFGWFGRPVVAADLWLWLAVLHGGMFALTTFSAHYFAWFTPFVALALARRPEWRGNLPLHLLQAIVVIGLADLLGGPGTTWGLFQPLAPDLVDAVPNLRELTLTAPDLATQLAGALRTAFVVLMVIWLWFPMRELWGATHDPGTARPVTGRGQDERTLADSS